MTECCGHAVYRSTFQVYGTLIAFARMVVFGIFIGALGAVDAVLQCSLLLFLAVAYLVYLRCVVPYSRRDEMALEYFVALLDILIYSILLAVCFVDANDFSQMNSLGGALIGLQLLGYVCYFINRLLIVFHAFTEVVCSGCCSDSYETAEPERKRTSAHHLDILFFKIKSSFF